MEIGASPVGAGDGEPAGRDGAAVTGAASDDGTVAEGPGSAAADADDVTGGAAGGLTEAEAEERLARVGPNALAVERRHLARTLASKLTGPVPYLLEAAIVLELAAGKVT